MFAWNFLKISCYFCVITTWECLGVNSKLRIQTEITISGPSRTRKYSFLKILMIESTSWSQDNEEKNSCVHLIVDILLSLWQCSGTCAAEVKKMSSWIAILIFWQSSGSIGQHLFSKHHVIFHNLCFLYPRGLGSLIILSINFDDSSLSLWLAVLMHYLSHQFMQASCAVVVQVTRKDLAVHIDSESG